jgi:hypothetical protein
LSAPALRLRVHLFDAAWVVRQIERSANGVYQWPRESAKRASGPMSRTFDERSMCKQIIVKPMQLFLFAQELARNTALDYNAADSF